MLIYVDLTPQHFVYAKQKFLLNKFGLTTHLSVVPSNLLLSQKIYAVFNRPRTLGRDFFDIVFLLESGVQPDMAYLEQKLKIKDATSLKQALSEKIKSLDLQNLAADLQPFLFNVADTEKVIKFKDFIENIRS